MYIKDETQIFERCDAVFDGMRCERFGGRCQWSDHIMIQTVRLYPYGYWSRYIKVSDELVEYLNDEK